MYYTAAPESRRVARCSTPHWRGGARPRGAHTAGAQALAQPTVGLQPGARADIVTLDTTHPSLNGRRRDAVLDGWIFAAGAGAVACVWAGGNKVVEGGCHRLRQKARETFNAAVQR